MRPVPSIALAAALLAAPAFAASDVLSQASRADKGILVLQVGSDWCVSGEDVRKAFESDAFRRAVGSKFVLAVHDEKERMDDATKAANKLVAPALVKTKRFPALTLVTPQPFRFYAQIENIPSTVTGEKLAAAVKMLTKRKDEAEALFKKGASLAAARKDSEAADAYGAAFDILERQVGDFNAAQLRKGSLAYAYEWKALSDLDAGDRFGWVKHFELDVYKTVALVEKLTAAKSDGSGGAKEMVQNMKAIPDAHFSPNQRQFVKVLEYALTSEGTDKPLSPHEKDLMKEAFAMGRDTFWGQFAMGRLMMDGEKIESKGLKRAAVRPRPTTNPASVPAFALDKTKTALSGIKPGAKLNEQQKLAAARYAVLRLIGQKGWHELAGRPGSTQFIKAFMNDREWLEDFAWSGPFASGKSGPGDGAKAVLALESLVYQDAGRWVPFAGDRYADNEGRRCMTALALVYPEKDEAWLADVLDAYRSTALAGRLNKAAYTQPTWLWRFAVNHGRGSSGTDNMAAQQRHLDKFVNLPSRAYGGTCWMICYRLKNCFGDSVHGPFYYKPWATAGEWPKRRYTQIVGGVCGELSKFGSATANAHGLPSTTVGQPGHCAYTRRLANGRWELNYSVTGHSQMHLCFWNRHEWQYTSVIESTFSADREKRLAAERMLALAALAEESGRDAKSVEMYYRYACAAHITNFDAWTAYGDWLARAGKPDLDKQRVWVRGCARGLKSGRQPVWNFLTPYFARVAKDKGAKALAEDLVAFAPNLRQCDARIQEESDFRKALETWTKPLEREPQLCYDVLKAMLDAQYGTSDYFSQTLGWGSDVFMKSSDGLQTFIKCIGEVLKERASAGEKPTLDFKPLILGASQAGNLEAFRQMADLQARISPEKTKGERYSKNDFGGTLLSEDGLLRTSTTSQWDTPARYAYVIDSSPARGNGFHTAKEKAPWAEVMLPGPSSVLGLVIENRSGGHNATRQVPIYVDVSEDGTSWQRVFTQEQVKDTFRVDLRKAPPRARHVRVGRVADAKEDVFHLGKVLVYGKKLY